jgi:hypothetical protein
MSSVPQTHRENHFEDEDDSSIFPNLDAVMWENVLLLSGFGRVEPVQMKNLLQMVGKVENLYILSRKSQLYKKMVLVTFTSVENKRAFKYVFLNMFKNCWAQEISNSIRLIQLPGGLKAPVIKDIVGSDLDCTGVQVSIGEEILANDYKLLKDPSYAHYLTKPAAALTFSTPKGAMIAYLRLNEKLIKNKDEVCLALSQFQLDEEVKSIEISKKEMQKIEADSEKADKSMSQYIIKGMKVALGEEASNEVAKLEIPAQLLRFLDA